MHFDEIVEYVMKTHRKIENVDRNVVTTQEKPFSPTKMTFFNMNDNMNHGKTFKLLCFL